MSIPHRRAALIFLLLAPGLAGTGCATSLRRDLRERPNGSFGEEALASAEASVGPATDSLPVPATTGQVGQPSHEAPAPGPVRAGELAAVGVDVGAADLGDLRRADWRPSKHRLTYSAARGAFLARSPELAAAAERYRAAFTRYDQVDYLNDLVRQYDAFGKELRTGAMTPTVRPPDIRDRFPFAGVAELQGDLVSVDVDLSRVRFERRVLAALVGFEQAWQGAHYWQRAAGILSEVVEVTGRMADAARARYRAGSVSHANLIQAELRLEELKQRLATARAQNVSWKLRLASVLDLPPDRLDGVQLSLDSQLPKRPARKETRALGLRGGPGVAEARFKSRRAELMVQLAERQLLPALSPALSRDSQADAPAPRGDIRYATGGPFLRELRFGLAAAKKELAGEEQRIVAVADGAWVKLDDALRFRYIDAGPQSERAELAVKVAERGYRAGTASFFDLDSAVQLFLRTRLEAQASLRDAFVAAAELRLVTGTGAVGHAAHQKTGDDSDE